MRRQYLPPFSSSRARARDRLSSFFLLDHHFRSRLLFPGPVHREIEKDVEIIARLLATCIIDRISTGYPRDRSKFFLPRQKREETSQSLGHVAFPYVHVSTSGRTSKSLTYKNEQNNCTDSLLYLLYFLFTFFFIFEKIQKQSELVELALTWEIEEIRE